MFAWFDDTLTLTVVIYIIYLPIRIEYFAKPCNEYVYFLYVYLFKKNKQKKTDNVTTNFIFI